MNKRKETEETRKKYDDINHYGSYDEFISNLSLLHSDTEKKIFCKKILQKLQILHRVRYRTTDNHKLESLQVMTSEIARICRQKQLWNDPEIEQFNANHNMSRLR